MALARDKAALQEWCKDIAPSPELRQLASRQPVILLTAARQPEIRQAAVPAELLRASNDAEEPSVEKDD